MSKQQTTETTITCTLPNDQALALAQLCKRITWSEMRACAVDDAETQQIRAAVEALRTALAEAGWAPR